MTTFAANFYNGGTPFNAAKRFSVVQDHVAQVEVPCVCPEPPSLPNVVPVVVVPPSGNALNRQRDLRYDNLSKQLVMSAGRDLVLTYDLDAIRQACEFVVNTFQGEWFLDTGAGVPWFQQVLVKAPNIEGVKQMLREKLLAVPGVNTITGLLLDFDRPRRVLVITFSVSSDFGELTGSTTQGL